MQRYRFVILLLAALGGGCTWVELTKSGENVRVATPPEVQSCKHMGTTDVSVRNTVAGIERDRADVSEELRRLARNSAPQVGGDTVVPQAGHRDGRQTFDVYRCR